MRASASTASARTSAASDGAPAPGGARGALRSNGEAMALVRGSPLLRFGTVAALVVFDQWAKVLVFRWLGVDPGRYEHNERPLFGTDWLSFANSCNGGAAFGQFGQFPWVLVVGRIAAVLF